MSGPISKTSTAAPSSMPSLGPSRGRRARIWRRRWLFPSLLLLALSLAAAATVGARHLAQTSETPEPKAPQAQAPLAVEANAPATSASPNHADPSEPPPAGDPDDPAQTQYLFGKARTFRHALSAAGLNTSEGAQVEQALRGKLDFRRCKPNDIIEIERAESGELTALTYRTSKAHWWSVTRDARGQFQASAHQLPETKQRLALTGTIETSLGAALEHEGNLSGLAGAFVQVFGRKMRFDRDTRSGDRFKVLVDIKQLGGEFSGFDDPHALTYESQAVGTLEAYAYRVGRKVQGYYDRSGNAWEGGWMRVPVRFSRISSHFDLRRRHPILGRVTPHLGVDYAAPIGEVVRAAAAGTVSFAGRKGPNGNLVILKHRDGYTSYYAHLQRFARNIKAGVSVKQGEPIGHVGSTGRSTGPHLHFGVKRFDRFLDPLEVLHAPGPALTGAALQRFKAQVSDYERQLKAAKRRS